MSSEVSRRTIFDQIKRLGLSMQVRVACYVWTREFTRDEYLRLLNTYSDHRSLDDERRARLFACTGDVIDKEFGAKVTRPYLSTLYLAKKRPELKIIEDRK